MVLTIKITLVFYLIAITTSVRGDETKGPISLRAVNIDSSFLESAVRQVNSVIHIILDLGSKVALGFGDIHKDIAMQLLTAISNTAKLFSSDITTIKGLIETMNNLKVILDSIENILKDMDKIGIPTNLIPMVGQIRFSISVAIPSISTIITTLGAISSFGKK